MKKIIAVLIMTMFVSILTPQQALALNGGEKMRAVWIATVSNIDFPSVKNNATAQKQEYIQMLDHLKSLGMNTVVVQVRPKADALYQSAINPWSDVLTGKQGQYPGYDPMAFMIEEAHKRGMEFHAWLNPYRITTSGTDLNKLSENHPARLNPSWVMTYNNALYYNPELAEVKQHIQDTVAEIVSNYNVDAIHFDDYFYPSNYPLPKGETKDGAVANSRRNHVNDMVEGVSRTIKSIKPNVEFGISPMGIWKNDTSDLAGSATGGGESYYSVYADTVAWIQNGWIDYVVPQIYWEIGHKVANYETLVKWWSKQVSGTNVKLYIGQGIYKDVVANEIQHQLLINENYQEVQGSVYFSYKDLKNNRKGANDQIKAYYGGNSSIKPLPQPEVPTVTKTGTVTTNGLNVRSGAGTDYPSITKLDEGTTVSIIKTQGDWLQILLPSKEQGWVSGQYVKFGDIQEGNAQVGAIKLKINGTYVTPPVAPILKQGTTLVPLRIVSENLGAEVVWDNATKKVVIMQDNKLVELVIGDTKVFVDGQMSTVAIPPEMKNGTTMVPIRFISENLGANVEWNEAEKTVIINTL